MANMVLQIMYIKFLTDSRWVALQDCELVLILKLINLFGWQEVLVSLRNSMTQVWSDQTVSFLIYLYVLYAASKWQLFPVPAVIIASEMDPH
jgi:hypothetical protein